MGLKTFFSKVRASLQSLEPVHPPPGASAVTRPALHEITPPRQYDAVRFELDAAQIEKLNRWLAEVHVRAAKMQIESGFADKAGNGQVPHYGAIGGGYTFTFSPSGLGTVCKVREAITKEELDLTDYDNW